MKRIPLLITLAIVFLISGGIWIYQSTREEKITPWDLIGNDAAIVLELNSTEALKRKLESLPTLKKLLKSSNWLSSVVDNGILQGGKVFISVHPTSRDDFGFVVYGGVNPSRIEAEFVEYYKAIQKDLSLKKRLYNGIEINEFLLEKRQVFSYAIVDEILLMSGSSFLLEGALRLRSSEESSLFKNSNSPLFRLPTLQSDEGNIYLNVSNFIELIKLVLRSDRAGSKISLLGSSLADIKMSKDHVLINGFVLDSHDDVLALFQNQQPQSIDMESLVSNRTAVFVHYGISDASHWFADQEVFLQKKGVTSTDSLAQALSKISVKVESIRKSIGNQFANCYLSGADGVVSIIKLKAEVNKVSVFDELSSKIATQKRDSLYVEDYAGYQIKLIDYPDFLNQLFYPLASPSEQSYFVRIGQFLMLAENVELLKFFIDDMDIENTWGKSVEWNKFLSSSLQESNVNLFFDGKLVSVLLKDQLNTKWKPFFDSTYFMGIDKGGAQLSRLESNFYLNASLQFSELQTAKANNNLAMITYDIGSNVVLPVKVVKSHVSKEIEVMVLDSLNNLYLLSKDLKIQWKQPIEARIVDDIEQLDFLANGKLQYFFTTKNGIHLVDRLGRNVDGFPQELKSGGGIIEYSSVVDYDRSKRYRYLITDVKGGLTLTDKSSKSLEGWNPRTLGGKMLKSARHYRVLGKDYIIAVQQNGTVNVLNRRGEMVRGFPFELGFRPRGEFFLTVGNTLSSTFFTVVSEDGMMVQFGLDGQIRKREVLLKRTGLSQFSLIKSSAEDSYAFLRTDPVKLGILDSEGKELFEVENPGSMNWQLTYLENRLKERYYCLYDAQQDFSYFYDWEGRRVLSQPLESTQLPTLYFDEKKKSLSIYNAFNTRLNMVSIKK